MCPAPLALGLLFSVPPIPILPSVTQTIDFRPTLGYCGLSSGNVPFKPASDHGCFLAICKIGVVWNHRLLVVRVVFHIDVILDITEYDMDEAVVICNVAFGETWEHLSYHLLCFARVVLLCRVIAEFLLGQDA